MGDKEIIMRQPHLILIITVFIAIIGALFYVVFFSDFGDTDEPEKGITAMEGKEIAEPVALNWSNNATFIGCRKASDMFTSGRFDSWYYKYTNSSIINNQTRCIQIKVSSDGNLTVDQDEEIGDKMPIFNWSIDSDRAYEIAMTNVEISSFLNHNPSISSFFIGNASGTSKWKIEWTYDAGFDNPKWAEIHIDASTGEVLYVEADT